jgi:hypothetical protein
MCISILLTTFTVEELQYDTCNVNINVFPYHTVWHWSFISKSIICCLEKFFIVKFAFFFFDFLKSFTHLSQCYNKCKYIGPAHFCFKHITVSNTLLCPAVYCVKQNTVSTLAFNIQLKLWVRIPLMAKCTRYKFIWQSLSVTYFFIFLIELSL